MNTCSCLSHKKLQPVFLLSVHGGLGHAKPEKHRLTKVITFCNLYVSKYNLQSERSLILFKFFLKKNSGCCIITNMRIKA